MTLAADFSAARLDLPALSKETAVTILFAGAAATLAFDMFGQALAPIAGYAKLAPSGLAGAVIKTLNGGEAIKHAGALLHYLTGLVFYVVGWLYLARPIQRAVLPGLHWAISAAIYGFALWVVALYGMAHLVAGMKPFLGFTGITWVALVGHVIYALIAAGVIEGRERATR